MLLLGIVTLSAALAQTPCENTPAYSPCELVFELNDAEAAEHPKPYLDVEMHAEFRSPGNRTFLMHAYWDGGRRMAIRFAPTEAGAWVYRLTSNIARFDGTIGEFTAAESDFRGFVRVENLRHFGYVENPNRPTPHLWMGDTCYPFATIDRSLFEQIVRTRASQKFNHLRGYVMGQTPGPEPAFVDAETPNAEYFRELDSRVRFLNQNGITADLILGGDQNHLAKVFPDWRARRRYYRYAAARYAAFDITWQGVQEFEEYEDGRGLLREMGQALKEFDPYNHIRSTHTTATSSPLLQDGWMDYIAYQSSSVALGAIEHQQYATPQVNTEFGYEDPGAGRSHDHHVDTDTFRKRLWNTAMNGQYPTYGNTGTYGGRQVEMDARHLNAPGAQQMTVWYDFFSGTRHWELEPYFDVDGGRALALTGVEYIVYLEKPGPVELLTEKRQYFVHWFNPITGERVTEKKEYKGELFTGQPPSTAHDWVLHLSRDKQKESMLERYYFESRRVPLQEIELDPKRLPYEIVEPAGDQLPVGKPVKFGVKLTRATRATRAMLYLWTAEVTGGDQGFRVLATTDSGEFEVPPGIVKRRPANLNLRLLGMNALGKVYSVNRVYALAGSE